ncbi:MAG: DNA-directed RNA polymerase subunit beta [Candidatus Sumerlaeia bacterium]|nr:DNA-directed RNA polymerase subunit beta [Candidatus Sumerlaeia bacterium]
MAAALPTAPTANGRLSYARIPEVMEMPYLLETQKQSYSDFLQFEIPPDQREEKGLQEVFRSVFPISSPGDPSSLDFVEYTFGTPKYAVKECIDRGMTYASPLKLKLQLIVREVNEETGLPEIRDIKEQEVYIGEVPLMTDQGTFIINGAERVIVSQLHRSPGVSFSTATHPNGRLTYSARIIPYRGAWVEFEIDIYGVMYVMIDRKRKIPATTFLRAFGLSDDERIADEFFDIEDVELDDFSQGLTRVEDLDGHLGAEYAETVLDESDNVLVERGQKVTKKSKEALRKAGYDQVLLSIGDAYDNLVGRVLGRDVIDRKTGEIHAETFDVITSSLLRRISQTDIRKLTVVKVENPESPGPILNTLNKDKIRTAEEAVVEFFRKMRPGNPVSVLAGKRLMEEMFFDERRYDLGAVGRYKVNKRFYNVGTGTGDLARRLLFIEDLIHVMKHLEQLAGGDVEVDDIDHLGNRRVRCVGELLQNQIRMGLAEIEKTARERMQIVDLENMLPQNLINAKPLVTSVRDFFGRSQLSQFMDQTNPLAELTHKRRLSALGPGGLSRDRAGFEVRDVHHTHYGRICPIETPEGPNIGLISSLSTYARINQFGFIETPYRKVDAAKVSSKKIDYLTADMEDRFTIAQANAPLDDKGRFKLERVLCRSQSDYPRVVPEEVQYMDISPKQLVSVSAALIPFLEHDDANRALMGSNMQRQAVPLLFTEAPVVGTGIERKVAQDSGVCLLARRDGVAEMVTAEEIAIRTDSGETDSYRLEKYKRSNQNTCINQRPTIHEGQRVTAGQVIADGPATCEGELALGRNVLVAFMSAGGYNFEDAILLSERLVHDDVFTSIHIEEFEIDARDTKLGKEEITRDIPNVSEDALAKLDEEGIVYIGAKVGPGDILVGKVTPKGETELSSEEKLLRAIFGEKAGDVRDASLKVPPGTNGIVIDVKTFSRKERGAKTEREDRVRIQAVEKDREEGLQALWAEFDVRLVAILKNLDKEIVNFETGKVEMKPGDKPSAAAIAYIRHSLQTGMLPVDGQVGSEIKRLYQEVRTRELEIEDRAKNAIDRIKTGDELMPGVIKLVKVYIASKRKISVGDKMAGRHGNKGVVARITPIADMPFLADGTPVDVVLNPLGVPSRMNVGQILETHLGWAASEVGRQVGEMVNKAGATAAREYLKHIFEPSGDVTKLGSENTEFYQYGRRIAKMSDAEVLEYAQELRRGLLLATPVFDGAKEAEVWNLLEKTGLPTGGQTVLYDGGTGEPFDRKVTVGVIYLLKLAHLVDDKMHARSIGPYSLVTQQPLGGKAQFGGQRFGEMEVWALEAYGSAYTLQELLTVKSDDVNGRTKIYESIVKGQSSVTPGIPESFNVLVKELQGLGLNLELLVEDEAGLEAEAVLHALEGVEDDSFLEGDEFGLDDDEPTSRATIGLGDEDDDEPPSDED